MSRAVSPAESEAVRVLFESASCWTTVVVVSLPPMPRAELSTTATTPPRRAEKIASGQKDRDFVMGGDDGGLL